MKQVIKVENLAKKFRINESRGASMNLREAISSLTQRSVGLFNDSFKQDKTHAVEEFWALQDVSFSVNEGEAFAIIGQNGSGKSTLLKILSKIIKPTSGVFDVEGRLGSLIEVGTGFHPDLSGRENVYLNGAIIGMSKKEIDDKFDSIVDFSGVEAFLDTSVKHYSSGMYLRLAFAVASHLEPDVLLVDEVLAVGDADFQKKCINKMQEIINSGRTVLFVSHNVGALAKICTNGILLRNGSIVPTNDFEQCLRLYSGSFPTVVEGEWSGDIGDENLRLHKITTCLNSDGVCCYERGDKFTVEISYEVLRHNSGIVVGVDVCNSSGDFLCATRMTDLLKDSELDRVQSVGKHNVCLRVDTGSLTEGSYLIKCNLGIHNVVRIIDEEPMLSFGVTHKDKNKNFSSPLYTSMIYPDWQWHID